MSEADQIAFDLAYGQLRSQKADLQFFRGQASFAAAVSGLISTVFATILGEKLLNPTGIVFFGLSPIGCIILICFALSVAFAVKAFMGWKLCTFDLNPQTALHYSKYELCSNDLKRTLELDADKYFDSNETVIADARHFLSLSLIFAWLQIPAWLLLLIY